MLSNAGYITTARFFAATLRVGGYRGRGSGIGDRDMPVFPFAPIPSALSLYDFLLATRSCVFILFLALLSLFLIPDRCSLFPTNSLLTLRKVLGEKDQARPLSF